MVDSSITVRGKKKDKEREDEGVNNQHVPLD